MHEESLYRMICTCITLIMMCNLMFSSDLLTSDHSVIYSVWERWGGWGGGDVGRESGEGEVVGV